MNGPSHLSLSISHVALALFQLFEEQGNRYCVMGDSRAFPDRIGSDIDIVIGPETLPTLVRNMFAFCAARRLRLVQCLLHERQARYFVLSWSAEDGRPRYLAPDVCGDYYRNGVLFLPAEELLADRRLAVNGRGEQRGFFVAAPPHEFIYYLLKCIDKERLDDRQGAHLSAQWRLDPPGAWRQLVRFWNAETDVVLLAEAARTQDWEHARRALPRLRAALRRRLHLSGADRLGELARRLHRLRRPTGLTVAFLGPDGSGKSSVIADVAAATAPAFRRVAIQHLRPRLLPGSVSSAVPSTVPHERPARGWLSSAAKLFYFFADYTVGYLFKVYPLRSRSTLVLFDRYYHDLLVDPRRYRYGARLRPARWLARLVPEPDLWLLLDAPADVVAARKRELTPVETARQREAYRHLALRRRRLVLDAARPFEEVVSAATHAILDAQACRTVARLSADLAANNPAGARWLMFFSRHRVPLLGRLVRIVFNSDIYARLPRSTSLPHPYGIVVHSKTVVGERVTLMQQVTLGGKSAEQNAAPEIGDDVYIGAGAKVLGGIRVGAGAVIGANAVVTRDVPPGATVVGANHLLPETRPTISVPPPSVTSSLRSEAS
jgi:thymidylate kinase